jgi:hypothetical protein
LQGKSNRESLIKQNFMPVRISEGITVISARPSLPGRMPPRYSPISARGFSTEFILL